MEVWHADHCTENVTYPSSLSAPARDCWVTPGEYYHINSSEPELQKLRTAEGECSSFAEVEEGTLDTLTPYGFSSCSL